MLSYSIGNAGDPLEQSGRWHIGEEFPELNFMIRSYTRIVVFADGDELLTILRKIEGIPKSRKSVQVWTGDFAEFILRNL